MKKRFVLSFVERGTRRCVCRFLTQVKQWMSFCGYGQNGVSRNLRRRM